ncbi:MAG: response regulator [Bacteriovorax sp.]|nr:response regulator [Bacteriovorax sp.]
MALKEKSKQTVLIVDDDADLIELLKESLEDLSFVVYSAKDGLMALKFLESARVDCIVTDIAMPNMTGPELIAKLQDRQDFTPFFFVTGYHEYPREDLNHFKPRAIIFKPFDFEEAALLIKNHLMRIS